MQKISFTVDGRKLAGSVFFPEKPKKKNPTILFAHGWTSAMERSYQYAEALSKLGYICFLFDNLGHGESEGDIRSFTTRDFFEGVLVAYDQCLKIEGVDEGKISAVGSSYGGYLVALLSKKRSISNLVLRVPADYLNSDFDKSKYLSTGKDSPVVLAWRKKPRKPGETFALEAINKFNGDILIIESEKDDTVPSQTIINYANAVKDKRKLSHIIMKGAPHSIKEGPFRDEVTRILVDWFKYKI